VRTCEKCGKANQPTRKFCIRCGASLLKKEVPVEKAPLPTAQTPQVPETPAPAPPPTTSEQDKFVKPSQVDHDRVRTAEGLTRPKAETVGIEEADGSGVIETRMLRASEVKELLEGPGMMAGGEEVPPPTMMEGSEPLPPEAAAFMPKAGPTSSQIEESILGSKSAFVEHPPEPEPEPVMPPSPEIGVPPETSPAGYEMEGEVPVIKATTVETPVDSPSAPSPAAKAEAPPAAPATAPPPSQPAHAKTQEQPKPQKPVDSDLDLVIACPDCGKVINVDMFEYPKEVYSGMGAARLKQARFFVVQGKPDLAMDAVRRARAFYEKADDKKGLKDVLKLVESLAKSG
jgi:hypothetical protein